MGFDAHTNFATSTVASPPVPADTGLSLSINPGEGARFTGIPPYNCTVTDGVSSEIVRVTARASDTFTILRAQEGSSAINIKGGMNFKNTITKKIITDLETGFNQITQAVSVPKQGAVHPGFGVNYRNLQANWATDIAYFKSIGITGIRPALPYLPNPWANAPPLSTGSYAQSLAYWRLCAQTFLNAGFYVTWGPAAITGVGSPPHMTASLFTAFSNGCIAEATYLQSQGIILGDFSIGNELENIVDGTTLTIAGLNAGLRTLATNIAAVYSGPVSYSTAMHSTAIADWLANGLGGLNYLSIHPYGAISGGTPGIGSFNQIASMINAFGSQCYISEFNLDFDGTKILTVDDATAASAMSNYLNTYILANGVSRFMIYTYCEQNNNTPGDLGFAQLYPQNLGYYANTFRPMWSSFFQ